MKVFEEIWYNYSFKQWSIYICIQFKISVLTVSYRTSIQFIIIYGTLYILHTYRWKIKLDNYVRHGIMCIYIHISFDTLRKWFVMVTERAFEGGDKKQLTKSAKIGIVLRGSVWHTVECLHWNNFARLSSGWRRFYKL